MAFTVETRDLGMFDVIVAGGGIAGAFAAVSAAREGGNILLIEQSGCLGGTLTAGSVPSIMDEKDKGGMLAELFAFLNERGMSASVKRSTRTERRSPAGSWMWRAAKSSLTGWRRRQACRCCFTAGLPPAKRQVLLSAVY